MVLNIVSMARLCPVLDKQAGDVCHLINITTIAIGVIVVGAAAARRIGAAAVPSTATTFRGVSLLCPQLAAGTDLRVLDVQGRLPVQPGRVGEHRPVG